MSLATQRLDFVLGRKTSRWVGEAAQERHTTQNELGGKIQGGIGRRSGWHGFLGLQGVPMGGRRCHITFLMSSHSELTSHSPLLHRITGIEHGAPKSM